MEGFILAGGKSSRMGTAKAAMFVGGKSMLERAADALVSIAEEGITVVGEARVGPSGMQILPDPEITVNGERASGAIVGLYGALSAARSHWIAVIACDMPFVSGEMFTRLDEYRQTGVDAIVPIQPGGRPQPLAALYRTSTCATAALSAIESGNRSMQSLLGAINTKFIPFREFADMGHAGSLFLNVNTPEDLRQAEEQV